MTEDSKKFKVIIAPGAFDQFEGSQEELNELMAQINQMVEDGTIFENSRPIDPDDPENFEILSKLNDILDDQDKFEKSRKKKLN